MCRLSVSLEHDSDFGSWKQLYLWLLMTLAPGYGSSYVSGFLVHTTEVFSLTFRSTIYKSKLWTQHSFPSLSLSLLETIHLGSHEAKLNVGLIVQCDPTTLPSRNNSSRQVWLHSSARINCFPSWKQLFGACTCLQELLEFSKHSQGHWPSCTTLQRISKKGFFRCNIENNHWNVASLVINLFSILLVMQTSCVAISSWTTSTSWIGDADNSSSSTIFTLHILLLVVWFLGWSSKWHNKHFASQWPLKLQWWQKFLHCGMDYLIWSSSSHASKFSVGLEKYSRHSYF